MTPTLALLGDVMLGRGVAAELASMRPAYAWAPELRALANSCDAVVCNLECCISERGEPTALIRGKRFFFRGPTAAVGCLEAIGVDAVGLANNHALDYGGDALVDTLAHVREAGIAVAGAGAGPDDARRGIVIDAGTARLGIVAVSDHPAEYAAGPDRPGIAYADLGGGAPEWLLGELARLRRGCDLVLAFVHWGPNMTREPAPWQQAVATQLAEAGADAVAGHSSHAFHGVGWSRRGPIAYDLGGALDDYRVDPQLRNDLGVMAIWSPGREPALELVGVSLDYCRTGLAAGADAAWIAARLHSACADLGTRVERTAEQRFAIRPG